MGVREKGKLVVNRLRSYKTIGIRDLGRVSVVRRQSKVTTQKSIWKQRMKAGH